MGVFVHKASRRADQKPDGQPDRMLRSSGQPLEAETRQFMEQRFVHDFSQVRVHTCEQAGQTAASLNARAFTLGRDVVFGVGEYKPATRTGRSLLAHELAHVVQQRNVPVSGSNRPRVSSPADRAEASAEAVAREVTAPDERGTRSSALRIRDLLRTAPPVQPTIQRAVKTWGGEYDTDKYELATDPGMDGVDIELRFKPGKNVNAELIGMVQTARSTEKGVPFAIGGGAAKKALESRSIPSGEAGAGTRIDRLSSMRIPLYGTDDPANGDSLAQGTPTSTTQHGFRYTDQAGKLQEKDALLKDTPTLLSTRKESAQVFETTALAVKGVQTGTFYGSVQWGWEKDAAGKVSKLPLKLVSQGVPSATFGRASELWNKSKTSTGEETIDLPVVSVKVISGNNVRLFDNPIDAMIELTPGRPLPVGTRIRVLDASDVLVHQITVVDGPLTGETGYIVSLGSYRDER